MKLAFPRHCILFCLILASATGCQLLHPTPPIEVQVRDAETQAPVVNARVSIWHATLETVPTTGVTAADGTVSVPSPPANDAPLLYEVVAKGYIARQTDQPAVRTASGVVLEVFAEPRPFVELVVPTGYRGLIRARLQVRPDLPIPPHQREYAINVPANGVVEIVLPPIFTRGVTPEIRTRYADGTPLSRTAKDYELGCRWLESDADSGYIFYIGTKYEADEMRRAIKKASGAAGVGGGPPGPGMSK